MSNNAANGAKPALADFLVPFVNPREHYRRYHRDIDTAIHDCLSNGDLFHRRQLFSFERHLADFVGTRFAVGVGSGYHALFFSLKAKGIGPGDEVITVAHTFAASVSAIVHTGATPVLVEVGSDFDMDLGAAESAITERTRAIMPVHLNGRICDMDQVMNLAAKHHLVVIEDACQALGASLNGRKAGAFGEGCFSFYPFKALGGFGDGGAVTTSDPEVARFVTLMRYNGEDRETGEFHYHGQTALLDNVQAAVLDAKLKHFPSWVAHRRRIAGLYHERLKHIEEVALPFVDGGGRYDTLQNYVIRAQRRDELRAFLRANGIETLVSPMKPMWTHGGLGLGNPNLPFTARICDEILSLPLSAETEDTHVDIVARAINKFYKIR